MAFLLITARQLPVQSFPSSPQVRTVAADAARRLWEAGLRAHRRDRRHSRARKRGFYCGPRIRFFTESVWGCQRNLSTPFDTSLSPEELERLKEILKQINRPFYYELQRSAAKRPEEEEDDDSDDDGKKEDEEEENEEEDEQPEPWRLT
jgi:hypothetical protein